MSNIDLMRDGYARYSARDYSFADELFAEDIDWRTPGAEPISGRDQVQQFFAGLREQFSAHSIELVSAIEDGDRLVCFCVHHFARPDGATGDVESVMDWRFQDGRAVSLHEIADTMAFAQIAGMIP